MGNYSSPKKMHRFVVLSLFLVGLVLADNTRNSAYDFSGAEVLSRRGQFSSQLDKYIGGKINSTAYGAVLADLLSDSFGSVVINTPFGSQVFQGKANATAWLLSLPSTVFNGFAYHRVINPELTLNDETRPTQIVLENYSPNLLKTRFAGLVEELSTEKMTWSQESDGKWRISSYTVDSFALLSANAVSFNIYTQSAL